MAEAVGLTIVKKFTYRGDASEEFSNQYWFTGDVPADATAWNTLRAAVAGEEVKCYPSTVQHTMSYGYDSDAEDATAVYQVDMTPFSTLGTLVTTGGVVAPGDASVWVRWKTSRTNTNGKPIYLRKYYHPAVATSGTPDDVLAAQTTALENMGLKMSDGTLPGGRTITARGHDDTILSHSSSAWITTRTLKRRGKRPGA